MMLTSEFQNLPKNWRIKELGEVCELCNGYAFKSSSFINKGVPVIRIGDIKNFEIDISNAMQVQISQDYENYQIQNGDLLIAMSGATTGKMGIYKLQNPAYLNQRVGNLKIKSNEIIPEYRNFALYALQTEIYKRAYGGAQPNISKGAIESLKIPLPPLEIQKRIVARLESAFEKIEKGSAHLQDAKTKLAKYKQSLLKSAFNDTLTATASLQDFEKAETIHTAASLRANEVGVVKHKKQILVILSVAKYPKIKTQMQQILWILRFLRKLRMTKIEIFHLRLNITKWEMTGLSTTANHAS